MYQLGGTCKIRIQIKIYFHISRCCLIKKLQYSHWCLTPVFLSNAFQMAYMQWYLKFLCHRDYLLQSQKNPITFISDMNSYRNIRSFQGLQCFYQPVSVIFKFWGIGNSKADSKDSGCQRFLHGIPDLVYLLF